MTVPSPAEPADQATPASSTSMLALLKQFVRYFTPSWMVITMGTGSVALTVQLFPFQFPGQHGLALAVWVLNVLLFATFLALLAGRAVAFSRSARELLEQPNQSLFLGALPMSVSVITGGVVAILVPRGCQGALKVAYALTWANLPIIATVALLVPIYMSSVHDLNLFTMSSLWLVPVIPGTAAAAVTGAVSKAMVGDEQAITLLYLGLCMLSVGLALSYHVLTIYYQRLVCHNLPPREVIVSSFIPVGAVGMAGWALLNLASAANEHLRLYYEGLPEANNLLNEAWLDAVLPACMAAAGVLGLCLWSYAGWWLVLAVSSVGQTLRQGIPFNLGWWGAVFPIGTFAGTTLALGNAFHSHPFKVLGAIISCCQVAVWLFVASMTLYRGWTGSLFHPPCLSPPAAPSQETAPLEQQLSQEPSVLLTAATAVRLRHHLDSLKRMESSMQSALDACPGVPVSRAHSALQLTAAAGGALNRLDSRGVHGCVSAVPATLRRLDTLEAQLPLFRQLQP